MDRKEMCMQSFPVVSKRIIMQLPKNIIKGVHEFKCNDINIENKIQNATHQVHINNVVKHAKAGSILDLVPKGTRLCNIKLNLCDGMENVVNDVLQDVPAELQLIQKNNVFLSMEFISKEELTRLIECNNLKLQQ